MMQSRYSRPQPILPISFSVAVSLAIVLCYLQILYGVSYLVRRFWNRRRESLPFRNAIVRWERAAVELVLCILPLPSCGSVSPSPTSTLYDNLPRHQTASVNMTRISSNEQLRGPSGVSVQCSMPQCYPGTSAERVVESQRTVRISSPEPEHITDHHARSDSSISTVAGIAETDRPNETTVEVIQQPPPVYAHSSQSLQQSEMNCHSHVSNIQVDQDAEIIEDIDPQCELPQTNAVDGPTDSAPEAQLSADASIEDGFKLSKRAAKCHSTESYPGRFPVSEGMNLSSLATAEYAFRERGTTSLRPFSDY